MESRENGEIKRQNSPEDVTLRDLDSCLRHMSTLLDTLETKINVLPKVDEKGVSECPDAESFYAQKEEEAEKVAGYLERLRSLLVLLEEELGRLRANLSRVQADAGSLHLKGAKERYLSAKQGLEHHIQKNLDKKKGILDLISRAEEMLRSAGAKKWPLGKPKERRQFPSITSGTRRDFDPTLSSGAPSHSGLSFEKEVENLFSLGPLG